MQLNHRGCGCGYRSSNFANYGIRGYICFTSVDWLTKHTIYLYCGARQSGIGYIWPALQQLSNCIISMYLIWFGHFCLFYATVDKMPTQFKGSVSVTLQLGGCYNLFCLCRVRSRQFKSWSKRSMIMIMTMMEIWIGGRQFAINLYYDQTILMKCNVKSIWKQWSTLNACL